MRSDLAVTVSDRDLRRGCAARPCGTGGSADRVGAGHRGRVRAVAAGRRGRGGGGTGKRVPGGVAGIGPVRGDTEVVLQGPAALVPVPVGDLGAVGSGDPGRSAGLLPLASAGRQAGPPALAATRRSSGAAAGSGGGEPGDRQVRPGPQVCGIDGGALRDGDPHVL